MKSRSSASPRKKTSVERQRKQDESLTFRSNTGGLVSFIKFSYNWGTSIPPSWLRIKGEDYFVQTQKNGQTRNTLEFLQETQKYIREIRKPIHLEASYQSPEKTDNFQKRRNNSISSRPSTTYTPMNSNQASTSILNKSTPIRNKDIEYYIKRFNKKQDDYFVNNEKRRIVVSISPDRKMQILIPKVIKRKKNIHIRPNQYVL